MPIHRAFAAFSLPAFSLPALLLAALSVPAAGQEPTTRHMNLLGWQENTFLVLQMTIHSARKLRRAMTGANGGLAKRYPPHKA